MYRVQLHFDVIKGQGRDALAATERLNGLERERGWRESTLWQVTFGPLNRFVEETEYETLADYERESDARFSDAAFMGAFRARNEFVVPGTGSRHLLERAV